MIYKKQMLSAYKCCVHLCVCSCCIVAVLYNVLEVGVVGLVRKTKLVDVRTSEISLRMELIGIMSSVHVWQMVNVCRYVAV